MSQSSSAAGGPRGGAIGQQARGGGGLVGRACRRGPLRCCKHTAPALPPPVCGPQLEKLLQVADEAGGPDALFQVGAGLLVCSPPGGCVCALAAASAPLDNDRRRRSLPPSVAL